MEKLNGKVKSFNKIKGYGFINGDDGNEYFFHFSSLNMEGFKTVNVEDKVAFEPQDGEKGKRALNIDIIK